MIERWRQPAKVIAVEESDHGIVGRQGSRLFAPVNKTVDRETFDRYKLGYLCFHCDEPQKTQMPRACGLCGYPMRTRQTADIALEYEGFKTLGPTTSVDEEIEQMRERKAKASSPIWTPRDAA